MYNAGASSTELNVFIADNSQEYQMTDNLSMALIIVLLLYKLVFVNKAIVSNLNFIYTKALIAAI